MPIADSKLLFIHIPKCAGTALEVALGLADAYPQIGLEPTVTTANFETLFGGGLQHLTMREIIENYPQNLTANIEYRFAVIRDPVDRFVSHFVWRNFIFKEEASISSETVTSLYQFLKELVDFSSLNPLFQNPYDGFVANEAFEWALSPNDIRRHLIPQCAFLYNRGVILLDDLFLLGNISALQNILAERFSFVRPLAPRMVGGITKALRERISPQAEQIIRSIYRHDQILVENVPERQGRRAASSSLPTATRRPPGNVSSAKRIPRNLWMFWSQGIDNAPDMVKRCVRRWIRQNPHWNIHVLDKGSLRYFVELPAWCLEEPALPLPTFADVLRIHLLARYGGVWADSTTWCVRPLDDWIDDAAREAGFFAYRNAEPDDVPLSSWFLAASENNLVATRWADAVDALWSASKSALLSELSDDPGSANYFWFHRRFSFLLGQDEAVANAWRHVPKVSNRPAHYLQEAGLYNQVTAEAQYHINNRLTNVDKLTRRMDAPENIDGTILNYLYNSHR